MAQTQSERDTKEEAMRAFKQFDIEHQGKISFENLKQVSRELGAPLPSTDLPTHACGCRCLCGGVCVRGVDPYDPHAPARLHMPCRREHDRRGDHGDDNSSRHRQGRYD